MSNERALWSAVVLQARDDLASERIGSVEYGAAVAFFTHAGEWRQSREAIADQLRLHADDLERLGRAVIAARRAAEGLPPVESKLPMPKKPRKPLPLLVAIPREPANDDDRPSRYSRRRHEYNPFNPFRNRA